jgi:regulator of sirC expression with transglutaminase-like and TPR domain
VAPFARVIEEPGATLDEMALALSNALQPDLDLIGALAALDQLAADCPSPTRDGVIQHLFGSQRFVGDRRDYHRWQNSCLDIVVASRRGMPITLAAVAIEVARRLGVGLAGVGLPGHFVVGDPNDAEWFADPFHGRSGLDRDDCRKIALEAGVSRWSERFLEPTPPRLIVARMLNNLRLSCERSGDRIRLAVVMQARQAMPEFADAEHAEATLALAVLN